MLFLQGLYIYSLSYHCFLKNELQASGKPFIRIGWQWEYWQGGSGRGGSRESFWQASRSVATVALCARASNRPECPPIYPLWAPEQVPLRILPLDKPHLLVPAVPADEDLDGVLGDGRGSWGLCLTHLWKTNPYNSPLSSVKLSRQHVTGLESW